MRVRYFEDTDTAVIEFGSTPAHETRELAEDLYADLDTAGRVVSITIEHASRQGDLTGCSFERVAAGSTPGPVR